MQRLVSLTALVACTAIGPALHAQEAAPELEARVWLDRGDEPVLRRGESVRVYYRTSEDAFAAIFRIDTDGRVHLIYPQHPGAVDLVRGERDYRLLFPQGPAWRVSEDPGVGYLFMVASPEPLDFSSFPYDEYHGWDLSSVGVAVYTDPYVAIDDYVARVVPNWETVPYALDFVTYSVGETYSYPRFLCYDCHTYRSYSSWNPYDYTCSTFRVVIWDDPYFYPSYRYAGVNVVVASRPLRAALPRYEVTRRVVGDPVRPVIRTRAAAPRREVEFKEPATAFATGRASSSARSRSADALASPVVRAAQVTPQERPQERPRTAPQEAPDTARSRPTLQRRPSSRLPGRTPPSREPEQPASPPARTTPSRMPARTPSSARPDASPTRPTAPSASSSTRRTQPSPTVRSAPSSTRSAPSSTRSAPSSSRQPAASPSQPRARAVPAPSSSRPSPQPSRPPAASRQPAPSRPQASPPRASGTSGGRPSASPQPARNAAPRSEDRPSVRPRSSDGR